MHIEDDIAREGEEDAATRYRKSYEQQMESRIDLVCTILCIAIIAAFAIAMYRCPGCSALEFCQRQAAQQQEGGAK